MLSKESERRLEPLMGRIIELKKVKARTEAELKTAEADVKEALKMNGALKGTCGRFWYELTSVAGGLTVDTDKLKADGLFERYSKPKAGYDKLTIKE